MTDQGIELAVSTVIFALRPHPSTGVSTLWLPLVRRIREPYEGRWALPGGPLAADEDLAAAARHTARAPPALHPELPRAALRLRRRRTARRPSASSRSSTGRWCAPTRRPARSTVRTCSWFVADELPELAFDHNLIVDYALLAAAHQDRVQPHRPRLPRRRRSPSPSCARCTRPCCASGTRPRELPPPGRGHQDPRPHRRPRHRRPPPPPAALPLRQRHVPSRRGRPPMTTRINHAPSTTVITAAPSASCDAELADGPWDFDLARRLRPRRVEGDVIPSRSPAPGQLPAEYQRHRATRSCTPASAPRRRRSATAWSCSATSTSATRSCSTPTSSGDSFQLANAAQDRPEAEAIVFCGVHFMAETADILARPEQAVILPNLAAGCSMADMADIDSVEDCLGAARGRCTARRARTPTAGCRSSPSPT